MAYNKNDNFDPYNVLLAIAINIAVLLMTAFVLQGHILIPYSALAFLHPLILHIAKLNYY